MGQMLRVYGATNMRQILENGDGRPLPPRVIKAICRRLLQEILKNRRGMMSVDELLYLQERGYVRQYQGYRWILTVKGCKLLRDERP